MFYKGQKKYKASPLFFIVSIGFFLSAFYGTYVPIASAADPTSVSLSASPGNAKLENDTDVTYTATSDQDVGPTIYYITIWEGATKRASCSTGTTCTYTTSGTDVTRTFTAKITKFDDTVFLTGDPGKTTQWLDFTVSLSANPSNAKLENGTDVTYTATANSDVGPSPYYIRIYEGATQRASCSTGTTCTYTTSGTDQTKTFTGKIETSGGTVVGISSDVSTQWLDFTVSLSANPSNAKLENGTDVTYTATANSDVGPSPYYIRIYEGATQRASCSTGTTCTYTTSGTDQTKTFTGKIETSGGTVVGISSDVSTQWLDFTVSLAASPSGNQPNGTSVTYTATANSDVGPSPYYIRIYEGATQRASCSTGTTCTYTTSGTDQTKTFTGKIETSGGTVVGISSDVSTTWVVSDTIAPNNVTNLSSSSHSISVWKNDSTVDVSWTAATDNAGGSGLDGYSVLWDTISDTLPDTTKDIEETVTFQTSSSLANGNSHYFHIRSVDNAGNWAAGAAHLGPFFIDTTAPNTPVIEYPAASSVQSGDFWVGVSGDGDTGGSGNTCKYSVKDSGVWTVVAGTRTCRAVEGASFQVTVGPGLNCRTPGGTCTVYAFAQDGAGNMGSWAMRAFVIEGILNFPSETWQRLWYSTSGASPSFSAGNFLGEGPNEASATFTTDWGGGNVAFGKPNNIGFKSSRTINFPTAGNYRFTIGSDDGARLFIDGTNQVDQWVDGSYRTTFKDIAISAGDHQFELDFYENGVNALVYFNYEPSPCVKAEIIIEDTDTLSIPIAEGTKECSLAIKHIGFDQTDNSLVSFETLDSGTNARTIGMDDNPLSGCQNNLKFYNAWDELSIIPPYNYTVGSRVEEYNASNTLGYGYEIFSGSGCYIDDFVSACTESCPIVSPQIINDQTVRITATYNGVPPISNTPFAFNFEIVECKQNSHCTADPNKANCNVDADNNGVGDITSNFNPNTCIDSVAPNSKITQAEDTPGNPPGFAPLPGSAYSAFLKADNNGDTKKFWWVFVEDTENIGGSGLDSCFISINGLTLPRTCNAWAFFTVGKPATGANCTEEGDDKCTIKVWAKDRAVNEITPGLEKDLNFFTIDERNYSLHNFAIFKFGVDWTAPTAQ